MTEPTPPTGQQPPSTSEPTDSSTPPPPPPPPPPASDPRQLPPPAPPAGYGLPPGGTAAQPLSPQDERTWSMLTHVITLGVTVVTSGLLGFVAALVLYLMYRDRGPFIRSHTANALNIQITTVIGALISFVLMFVLIGFFTLIAVGIYAVVMHIIGAVKANNGEFWEPPLTPRFVS